MNDQIGDSAEPREVERESRGRPDDEPNHADDSRASPRREARSGGRGRTRPGGRRGRGRTKTQKEPTVFPAGTVRSVTSLDARGARFEAEVDGVRGKVSAELIGAFALRPGRVLSEVEATDLTESVRRLEVFDRGVAILARRPRSARDLLNRLRQAGASSEDAATALQRLQALGLQDDNAYATHMAETRAAGGGLSKRRLQQDLIRKGVAPRLASSAVSHAVEGTGLDEEEGALALANRKLRSLRNVEPLAARRRLYGYLARRGYDSALISRVLMRVLGSTDSED